MQLPEYYRNYKLDDFQQQAGSVELLKGNSVLVSALPGSARL